jgi:hypothetical protein
LARYSLDVVYSHVHIVCFRATAWCVSVAALDASLRLLHPFMPFITEEVWQSLRHVVGESLAVTPALPSASIMYADVPEADKWAVAVDPAAEHLMDELLNILRASRSLVKSSLDLVPHVKCVMRAVALRCCAHPGLDLCALVLKLLFCVMSRRRCSVLQTQGRRRCGVAAGRGSTARPAGAHRQGRGCAARRSSERRRCSQ